VETTEGKGHYSSPTTGLRPALTALLLESFGHRPRRPGAALTLPGETIVRDAQGATLLYVYAEEKQRAYARRVEVGQATRFTLLEAQANLLEAEAKALSARLSADLAQAEADLLAGR
jgi:hypothetical protein